MKICSRCGQPLNDQQIFCHKCGLQIQGNVPIQRPIRSKSNTQIPKDATLVTKSEGKVQQKSEEKRLSNGFKVFISALVPIVPFIGSFIGLILSIAFINNKKNNDKQSYGLALLIESIIFLVLSICALIIFGTLFRGLQYELHDFFYYLR